MSELMTTEPPWYRQGWPWFIIAFPAMSVVLGIMMLVLAIRTDDGLVVDDYYTQGKTINRRIERDQLATRLGVSAEIRMLPAGLSVDLRVASEDFVAPVALSLDWVHVTDARQDGGTTLVNAGGGRYVSTGTGLPIDGRWRLHLAPVIEIVAGVASDRLPAPDADPGWRLVSDTVVLRDGSVALLGAPSAEADSR